MKVYNYNPDTLKFMFESEAHVNVKEGGFLIPAHATDKPTPKTGTNEAAIWNKEDLKWDVVTDLSGVFYDERGMEIDIGEHQATPEMMPFLSRDKKPSINHLLNKKTHKWDYSLSENKTTLLRINSAKTGVKIAQNIEVEKYLYGCSITDQLNLNSLLSIALQELSDDSEMRRIWRKPVKGGDWRRDKVSILELKRVSIAMLAKISTLQDSNSDYAGMIAVAVNKDDLENIG